MRSVSNRVAASDGDDVREYAVIKRSVIVGGHKTSVSLEDAFWIGLKDIAACRGVSLSVQIDRIDVQRRTCNLSSAIRIFVLEHYRDRAVGAMMIGERPMISPLFPSLSPD